MRESIRVSGLVSVAIGVVAALAGEGFGATFTNSSAIAIPAPGSSNGSVIAVSGLGNSITFLSGVAVTVSDFSETDVGDVGLVLVGPTGAALALEGDCGGSTFATAVSLTFSDAAASQLPANSTFSSGTYRPTQYASIGSFPSPGPGLAYNSPPPFGTSSLGDTFAFTNPNGNWSLYAIDPVSGDSGEIANGWTLQITAVPEPACLPLLLLAVANVASRRRPIREAADESPQD